ncbi:MAG: class I SAM-dependent methyltransferase family protein, partial [Candidatus Methanofastidiosia archaeon]
IKFLKMNLKLNKIENVKPILGDAKEIFPELSKIDRCIMNLPKSSFKFLSLALKYARITHLYSLVENLEREIEKIKNFDKRIRIGEIVKVKSYSPKKSIYRFDIWS